MKKYLFTDSSGKKSLTATVFVWGSLLVNLKLLVSGLTIGTVQFAPFGGSDYAMALGALGAIYVMRRTTDPANQKPAAEEANG
jgi:hypothetical protein